MFQADAVPENRRPAGHTENNDTARRAKAIRAARQKEHRGNPLATPNPQVTQGHARVIEDNAKRYAIECQRERLKSHGLSGDKLEHRLTLWVRKTYERIDYGNTRGSNP